MTEEQDVVMCLMCQYRENVAKPFGSCLRGHVQLYLPGCYKNNQHWYERVCTMTVYEPATLLLLDRQCLYCVYIHHCAIYENLIAYIHDASIWICFNILYRNVRVYVCFILCIPPGSACPQRAWCLTTKPLPA